MGRDGTPRGWRDKKACRRPLRSFQGPGTLVVDRVGSWLTFLPFEGVTELAVLGENLVLFLLPFCFSFSPIPSHFQPVSGQDPPMENPNVAQVPSENGGSSSSRGSKPKRSS